ncbi:MBL fold metallo-hydrolase [Frondihabitans sucicola]|uniref:MBL fold metallo-hydrolase n=1 Tax=Frondihabitans sucicola TaxID=1268041 RepID=A0ABM8GKL0_9MICO|nr:MBL fold metallo-hydrolase [Frondihabitans sucicola]BDZ48913.1 MBL fold metallo-hydrolase [Frondihabitans sucicola]
MPGEHIPCSFLYLLRDSEGGFHVVDPGWDTDANWSAFVAALETLGATPGDVRTITATHLHPDHLGLGRRMRDTTGAILQLHRAEAHALSTQAEHRPSQASVERQADEWGVPADRRHELLALALTDEVPADGAAADEPPVVDRLLDDGDRLDVPGFELVAIHTPGHTPGHLCLRDDARSLLVTGDHVLPTMFAGLGLGGPTESNALADYVDSVARVTAFGDHEALPGHGYRFTGLGERAEASAAHHLARTAEVARIVGQDPATPVWQIAAQLTWTAGFENLAGFMLFSALSQTEMHRDYVRR